MPEENLSLEDRMYTYIDGNLFLQMDAQSEKKGYSKKGMYKRN